MNSEIKEFLLIYDRANAKLLDTLEFGTDRDAALNAYGAYEQKFADDPSIEVVLIGSDSLETIRTTHPHYFEDWVPTSKYLAGI